MDGGGRALCATGVDEEPEAEAEVEAFMTVKFKTLLNFQALKSEKVFISLSGDQRLHKNNSLQCSQL